MTDEKTKQKAMEAAADIYGIFNKKKIVSMILTVLINLFILWSFIFFKGVFGVYLILRHGAKLILLYRH